MKDPQQRHVFISYVRENQKEVDRLCQDLERYGVNVWLDRKSIKPGARWKDAIRKAIRHGNFFIACFSEEYTSRQKNFMNEELTLAIDELRQFATDREWFIPVLMSECNVPARSIGAGETLLDINWVPLYEDWDAGIQRILYVIKPIHPEIRNLISALCSEDKDLRKRAANALGKISEQAAVKALIKALKDEDNEVRWSATWALGKIGPSAKMAMLDLIEAIEDKDRWVREYAVWALGNIGPEAKAAIPSLIEALKDKDQEVRCQAALALGKIAPVAKTAVPALCEALKDKDEKVREYAAKALGNIGLEAVSAMIESLKDNDYNVRYYAAKALGCVGSEARAAVPDLIEALKSENEFFRQQHAWAFMNLNPENWEWPELNMRRDGYYAGIRKELAKALGNIGPEAVPALIEALKDEDEKVCEYAAEALGDIGLKAVSALVEALKDEDEGVRWWAANTLGKIGPEAKTAVPNLIGSIEDENESVRISAALALGEIDPESKMAVAAIIKLLNDDDGWVRRWAVKALKKIDVPEALKAIEDYYKKSN